MDKDNFCNQHNKTLSAKLDRWILDRRNAILEWYDAERIKEEYAPETDEDMLALIATHIDECIAKEHNGWWLNVVYEVAEGLLDLEEWELGHHDIEEYLVENTNWRKA